MPQLFVYFWRLERLKQDLIAGTVSERSSLSYLLWFVGVTTALYAIPLGELNVWDHVDSIVVVLGFLLGTLYLYRCNLGDSGDDFLTRFVSLGWVFSIRFTVLTAIPAVSAGLIIESFLSGGIPEHSTAFESAVLALLEAGYYLRLGHHFSEVSSVRVAD